MDVDDAKQHETQAKFGETIHVNDKSASLETVTDLDTFSSLEEQKNLVKPSNTEGVSSSNENVVNVSEGKTKNQTDILEQKNQIQDPPNIDVTSPNADFASSDKKPRTLLTFSSRGSLSENEENSFPEKKVPVNKRTPSWRRSRSLNSSYSTYENPNFLTLNRSAQEYYQFLHRYHIADTLPVYGRTKLQIELRKLAVDHINIGLFGQPSSGKSAFLNTVYAAITGEYVEYSAERKVDRNIDYSSLTDKRVELRLTESISVIDNRGVNFTRPCFSEVSKQCEGLREAGEFIPPDWKVGCRQSCADVFAKCHKKQLFRNRIHCPVFVSSLKQDIDAAATGKCINILKKNCGCNPIIVITHPKSAGQQDRIERMRQFEGMNCARIFCIENYTFDKNNHDKSIDENAVEILFNCCLVSDQSICAVTTEIEKGVCC